MMKRRSLALLGQSPHVHDIIASLSTTHGWQPWPYRVTAGKKNKDKAPRVGLVVLNLKAPQELQKLISLKQQLSTSSIYWLALLDTIRMPGDIYLNSLLNRFFHGQQILPCSLARINGLLDAMHELHEWQTQLPQDSPIKEGDAPTVIGGQLTTGKLFDRIKRFAEIDAPVLISGETGTGKELAAHAIHKASARANSPFVAVNCGALPESLAQSELYGYEKGAFTGAYQQRKGYIEAASGGTLFLDEIGDLPLATQVSLLRFLETQKMMRVGGVKEFHVNVRVISATHVDLSQAVIEGRFREDLYHRLNVLGLYLPPLRERLTDIQPLAELFFHRFRNEGGCRLLGISQEALDVMHCHAWPGNIRELMNRMRRAILYSEAPLLMPTDMGLEQRQQERYINSLEQVRQQAEYRALQESLMHHSYNLAHVANELGISRITLYRLIEKYRLKVS